MNIIEVADEDEAREIARTLNEDRRAMPKEERLPVVVALREEGHSLRAIAGAVGVDKKQVQRDLEQVGTVSPPATSRGLDGKTYPARRAPKLPDQDALAQAAGINRQRREERKERHIEQGRTSTPVPDVAAPTFRAVGAAARTRTRARRPPRRHLAVRRSLTFGPRRHRPHRAPAGSGLSKRPAGSPAGLLAAGMSGPRVHGRTTRREAGAVGYSFRPSGYLSTPVCRCAREEAGSGRTGVSKAPVRPDPYDHDHGGTVQDVDALNPVICPSCGSIVAPDELRAVDLEAAVLEPVEMTLDVPGWPEPVELVVHGTITHERRLCLRCKVKTND